MLQYNLDQLGWYQFEWLCQALLKASYSLAIEAWGGHSDRGRDAYHPGPLEIDGAQVDGALVFQAKFVQGANAAGAAPKNAIVKAVASEIESIETRTKEKHPDANDISIKHYCLLTNAPLSATLRETLRDRLAAVFPGATIVLWDANDICAALSIHRGVRLSFPQLLGAADFDALIASVVNRDVVARSTVSLSAAGELLPVFVPTKSYYDALRTLNRHKFVVLTGPPEMGKTTIARVISVGKFAEDWEVIECREPGDFFRTLEQGHPQVFVADDAFGSTEFRPEHAQAWGSDLDSILRRLDDHHWLLWTSRPAPLNAALARIHRQGKAENFPKPAEVLVDASQLTQREKALMLYRHAKEASLSLRAKEVIRSAAPRIIGDAHFTPLRARRLVRERIPHLLEKASGSIDMKSLEIAVAEELHEPTTAMRTSFKTLSQARQRLLVSLLDTNASVIKRDELRVLYERHAAGLTEASFDSVLDDLSSHFLRQRAALVW